MNATPPNIPDELLPLAVPVADLTPFHRNPRNGDLVSIRESLTVNGQYKAIVVNRGTHTGRPGEILAGNHTFQAAVELGWENIAATWVDVDDDAATRIVVVDNRTSDLAGYDSALLAEILEELPDLQGTGYDQTALDELLDASLPAVLPAETIAGEGRKSRTSTSSGASSSGAPPGSRSPRTRSNASTRPTTRTTSGAAPTPASATTSSTPGPLGDDQEAADA